MAANKRKRSRSATKQQTANEKGNSFQRSETSDDRKQPRSKRGRADGESYGRTASPRGGADSGRKLSSLNDLSWYTHYPELVVGTARVPFPNRPGRRVPVGSISQVGTDTQVTAYSATVSIPGVMALDWVPSVGFCDSVTDPASVVGKEMYSRVRRAFSSQLDADPPDYVIYLMAFNSVFSYLGKLKRIYRLLDAYSPNNYAMPDALLYSQGLTTADIQYLRTHKADFFTAINQLIYLSRKFVVPNVMDIFSRHYWMNDNVYTDDATINSQFYIFNQVGFYKFGLSSGSVKHGMLKLVRDPLDAPAAGDRNTVDLLYNFGSDLISAIAESDDGYTISGYLMRAYEGASSFYVDNLSMDEEFKPVFVPEVLMQIENSAGLFTESTSWWTALGTSLIIDQNPGTNSIIHTPFLTAPEGFMADLDMPLSIRSDMPSEGDVIIATRLKPCLVEQELSGYQIRCGTEIPLAWNLWYPTGSQVGTHVGWATTHVPQYTSVNVHGINSNPEGIYMQRLIGLLMKSQFDWCPISYVLVDNSASSAEEINATSAFMPAGDIHNFTTLTDEVLSKIHQVCVYSELNAFDA
nr:capsid protein [Rat picobirnavirus]